jgi:hypothetical protein
MRINKCESMRRYFYYCWEVKGGKVGASLLIHKAKMDGLDDHLTDAFSSH